MINKRINLPGGWYFEQSEIDDEEPSWRLCGPSRSNFQAWWLDEQEARAFAAAMMIEPSNDEIEAALIAYDQYQSSIRDIGQHVTLETHRKAISAALTAAKIKTGEAVAAEKERCAKIAEQTVETYHPGMSAVDVRLSFKTRPRWISGPAIAAAIRA